MPDYYSLLERKIKETQGDPAKMRQVVYEAARLALKRQVLLQRPPIAIPETRRLLNDLEDAIVRFEADVTVEHDLAEIAQPEDDESGSTDVERNSRPEARHEPDDVEDDETDAGTNRAAPERRAGGTHASSINGRYAFAEPEEDETPTHEPPTEDRRRHFDLPSDEGLHARDYDEEPVDEPPQDDESEPLERFAQSEDEEAPPTRARPANHRRTRAGLRSDEGLRARDHDDRGPADDVNDDDESDPPGLEVDEPTERPRNRFSDRPDRAGDGNWPASRELVLVPDRSISARRGSAYLVRPDDFPPSPDVIYEAPPEPLRGFGPMLLSGSRVLFHIAVATLAAIALYVTVWQRNFGGQPTQDAPAMMAQDKGPARGPTDAAPAAGPSAGETASAVTGAATVALPVPLAPAFPYPTSYGIYAISDNQLIELEQVPTAAVDPRTRTVLQIVKPSRTVLADPHLTFIAFRRDLVSSAPEKVPVRIAARIARTMIFDASGKPVVNTPANESWLIRDQGYDLRVAPVRESAEMVTFRPENPDFVFPAGRYELMIGGQPYDFVIAGAVTDPAQCVEGFATVRGPAFYECKTP